MCTTRSHDVVVGTGGNVVVLVVLVVLVVDEVVEVGVVDVVDVVDVVAMSVDAGASCVLAVTIDDEDEATLVGVAPSADRIRSLHAAAVDRATNASTDLVARFIPRARPNGRRRAGTLPLDRAPSTRRDGR
jgi:hypothetical protein